MVTVQPSDGTGGTALGTQPSVQVQDLGGNPVNDATDAITLAITAPNTPVGSLTCTTNPVAADGVTGTAVFDGCEIDKVGTYTLTASASGLTSAESSTFTVTAGAEVGLSVETAADGTGTMVAAQDLPSGTTLTAYAITRDAGGNFVANVAATWSLAGTTGSVIDGDLVAAGDAKSALLTGSLIGSAKIHADNTTFTGDSGTITIVPGTANKVAFTVGPTNTAETVTIAPAVEVAVEDAAGNVITDDNTTTIALTLVDNPAPARASRAAMPRPWSTASPRLPASASAWQGSGTSCRPRQRPC